MTIRMRPLAVLLALALGDVAVGSSFAAPMPQFYGTSLRLVAPDGLPSGSVATVTAGAISRTTAPGALRANGGLAILPLPLSAAEASDELVRGGAVDVAVTGPGVSGKWRIESVAGFGGATGRNVEFVGQGDTDSRGTLVPSGARASAHMEFTGQKNNYVSFAIDKPLPADSVAVGGFWHSAPSAPVSAYAFFRVVDSRGETYGYMGHGEGYDEAVPQSVPLTRIRYRYGAHDDLKPASPASPATVSALLLEPSKWKYAGPVDATIDCVYAVRQLAYSANAVSRPSVTVDLDKPIPENRSMSGFLHGISGMAPSDNAIRPLKPALWRVGFENWMLYRDRLKSLGVTTIYVLSDLWGYDKNRSPYDHAAEFDAMIDRIAPEGAKYDVVWDIWNEPDGTMPWNGPNRAQFHAVFAQAERTLKRDIGESARIEGPSFTHYDHVWIESFLDACLAQNVKLDYLSWHELDVDGEAPILADHLKEARRDFVENPKYKALGLRGIHINETVGQSAQYHPGEIVGYLRALEDGGADGACKGCWYASDGGMNGFNDSIDGIVAPGSSLPRAAWWAYKSYADGTASRVSSTSTDLRLAAIASEQPDKVQVLLGCSPMQYFGGSTQPTLTFTGLGHSRLLGATKRLKVEIARLPDSGEAPLATPVPVSSSTVAATGTALRIDLPAIAEHEALIVTVTPE